MRKCTVINESTGTNRDFHQHLTDGQCCNWRASLWIPNQKKTKKVERSLSGLTGDRVESKGASSGRPDLPVSVSPAVCRARPSAIATKNAHFAFLAIFWEVRKVVGLTGDRAESKRASSGRPDLPVTVLLLPAARDRVP